MISLNKYLPSGILAEKEVVEEVVEEETEERVDEFGRLIVRKVAMIESKRRSKCIDGLKDRELKRRKRIEMWCQRKVVHGIPSADFLQLKEAEKYDKEIQRKDDDYQSYGEQKRGGRGAEEGEEGGGGGRKGEDEKEEKGNKNSNRDGSGTGKGREKGRENGCKLQEKSLITNDSIFDFNGDMGRILVTSDSLTKIKEEKSNDCGIEKVKERNTDNDPGERDKKRTKVMSDFPDFDTYKRIKEEINIVKIEGKYDVEINEVEMERIKTIDNKEKEKVKERENEEREAELNSYYAPKKPSRAGIGMVQDLRQDLSNDDSRGSSEYSGLGSGLGSAGLGSGSGSGSAGLGLGSRGDNSSSNGRGGGGGGKVGGATPNISCFVKARGTAEQGSSSSVPPPSFSSFLKARNENGLQLIPNSLNHSGNDSSKINIDDNSGSSSSSIGVVVNSTRKEQNIQNHTQDPYRTSLISFDRALLLSDLESGPLGDEIDWNDSELNGDIIQLMTILVFFCSILLSFLLPLSVPINLSIYLSIYLSI